VSLVAPRPSPTGAIVEFFGLPGSGKSTAAELARKSLAELGVASTIEDRAFDAEVDRSTRIVRKLSLAVGPGLAHPLRSARALGRIAVGQRSLADALGRSLQWQVAVATTSRARRRAGLHLLQEGTLQALWSIALRRRVDAEPWTLAAALPERLLPDLVVVVEAPLEVVAARLEARGSRHSRTQRLDGVERDAELQRGQALVLELLQRWTSERGPDRTVLIRHASADPPDVDELVGRITALTLVPEAAAGQ
jgi:thymidylate kinase